MGGKREISELEPATEQRKDFDFDSIINEYKEKEDEFLVESDAGSSAGSDEEPSEDNMSDDEIAKILPVRLKKAKQKKKLVSQNSLKKRKREFELRLKEKNRKREEDEKAKKSPVKRISNYKNALKDRFNLSRIKKVEMVDAWTQTSNRGSDTENEEKKEVIVKKDDVISLTGKNTVDSFYSTNKDESPTSMYKRNHSNTQKYKINVNSTLTNNKTFRSPISNSISNDYMKKDFNTSFTLSKSKPKLYNTNEFYASDSTQHQRHNSSNLDKLGDRYKYAQRNVRKSPQKAYNPPITSNSNSLL
jgi:hypothetical protein